MFIFRKCEIHTFSFLWQKTKQMTVSQIILKEETAFQDPTTSYATKAIRQKQQLGKNKKE